MKKPTLLRGISIASLTIVTIGVAVFIMLTIGNYKSDTNQAVVVPIAPLQSAEQIKQSEDAAKEHNEITASAGTQDYAKTIELSYAYASKTSNDYQTRLDAYRVCMQAAFKAEDTVKNDQCYNESKTLLASLSESEQFKSDWQKELDAVYKGTIVPSYDNGDDVQ